MQIRNIDVSRRCPAYDRTDEETFGLFRAPNFLCSFQTAEAARRQMPVLTQQRLDRQGAVCVPAQNALSFTPQTFGRARPGTA